MSLMVASADRCEEGRDGHEATDLAQAGHVQRDPRDVSGGGDFRIRAYTRPVGGGIYRINVADVPRQRPSTPEEETIDRVVARMAWVPACLDRLKWQVRPYEEEEGLTFVRVGHLPAVHVFL